MSNSKFPTNLYFNPKTNKLGVGLFATLTGDMKLFLITDEIAGAPQLEDVSETLFDDWHHIGEFDFGGYDG